MARSAGLTKYQKRKNDFLTATQLAAAKNEIAVLDVIANGPANAREIATKAGLTYGEVRGCLTRLNGVCAVSKDGQWWLL